MNEWMTGWWLFIPTRLQYFTCILEMWCLNPIYHWQQKEFVECFVHVDVDFQIFLYVKKCIILVVWCEKIHLTWGFLIVSKSTHWLISLWFYCTCGKCQFSCVVSLPSPSCIPELAQKFRAILLISIHKITIRSQFAICVVLLPAHLYLHFGSSWFEFVILLSLFLLLLLLLLLEQRT